MVVFHHGYGDHVGRYQHVFKRLAASGYAVHTFDAVGHGRSPAHPKRGRFNVQHFAELRDDAVAFATHVLDSRYGGAPPPAFIMGCSLGGLIATYVVLADQSKWAKGGLVLMSAAMDVEWTFVLRVQAPMGALLAVLLPDAPLVPAVRAEDLSRNPAVVEAHKADTLVPHGNTKCRIGYEILQAFRNLQVRRYGEVVGAVCFCVSYSHMLSHLHSPGTRTSRCPSWPCTAARTRSQACRRCVCTSIAQCPPVSHAHAFTLHTGASPGERGQQHGQDLPRVGWRLPRAVQ